MSTLKIIFHALILSLILYGVVADIFQTLGNWKYYDKNTKVATVLAILIFLYGEVLMFIGAFHVCH